MRCELVAPGSTLWNTCLSQVRHDFYHKPEYVELCADPRSESLPRAFIARDQDRLFLVPLIFNPIEGHPKGSPLFDAASPYGYGSPVISTKSDGDQERFLDRAIAAMIELLKRENVVMLFCRLHPLLPLPFEPLRGAVVEHGPTVYCDLRRSFEELWSETRGS
jgi:hypothetical protein